MKEETHDLLLMTSLYDDKYSLWFGSVMNIQKVKKGQIKMKKKTQLYSKLCNMVTLLMIFFKNVNINKTLI